MNRKNMTPAEEELYDRLLDATFEYIHELGSKVDEDIHAEHVGNVLANSILKSTLSALKIAGFDIWGKRTRYEEILVAEQIIIDVDGNPVMVDLYRNGKGQLIAYNHGTQEPVYTNAPVAPREVPISDPFEELELTSGGKPKYPVIE